MRKIFSVVGLLLIALVVVYPQARLYTYMLLYSVTYANLGTPANGSIAYCSDCTAANPCSGSGSGVIARREAGAWNCASTGTATSLGFDAVTGATNTSAAMVVGTGASLGPSGTGTVTANYLPHCTDGGSNDTYACNLSPAPTGYISHSWYTFTANTANTGAATVNFNSLGAKTIKKAAGGVTTDLATDDIRAGQTVLLQYDGTNMQMQSLLGNAAAGGTTSTHHIWFDAGSSDNLSNTWRASFGNVDLDGYVFVGAGSTPVFATIAFRDAGSIVYFRYPIPSTYDGSAITVDLEADIDVNNSAGTQLDMVLSSTCVADGGAYTGLTLTAGSTVSTAITSGLRGKRKKISFTVPSTCAAGDRLIGSLERSASDTADNKILADGIMLNIVF